MIALKKAIFLNRGRFKLADNHFFACPCHLVASNLFSYKPGDVNSSQNFLGFSWGRLVFSF